MSRQPHVMVRSHPVAVSVAATALLAAALTVIWLVLPLSGSLDHAVGHLVLGVPVTILFVWAVRAWPALAPGRPAVIVRAVLLVGLALVAGGLVVEAVGAFGYGDDGYEVANDLAVLHDVGLGLWTIGFPLVMAGAVMSVGVVLSARRGVADSRLLTVLVIAAVACVVLFVAGGLIFGY